MANESSLFMAPVAGGYHVMVVGASGEGKSILGKLLRLQGHTFIEGPVHTDTPADMAAAEQEQGDKDCTPVPIRAGVAVPRWLFDDAIDSLLGVTGVRLSDAQMVELLAENAYDALLLLHNHVSTEIRDGMADSLARKLVHARWPNYGSVSDANAFFDRFDQAAREAGYAVEF